MKKRLIIICGLPGAGKTSLLNSLKFIDNELFKDYKYLDLDDKILESYPGHVDLAALIHTKGFQWFREIESQQLKNVINSKGKLVLSVGGGALTQEHFELLKEQAILVEVNISIAESIKRTSSDDKRPLSLESSEDDLQDIFAMRKKILDQAHIKVSGELPMEKQVEEFVRQIAALR